MGDFKERKEVKIIGGGVLNYCDKTNRKYLEYLKSINSRYNKTEAYKLLSTSTDAIIEFYRVCLYRSFGVECQIPYKMRCLEKLAQDCVNHMSGVINEVKMYDSTGINKYVFIQGCLTTMVRVQERIEEVFNCQDYKETK